MRHASHRSPTRTAETIVISPKTPLSAKKKALRRAVCTLSVNMLKATAGTYGAHPSAKAFPGAVRMHAPRIVRTLSLAHTPPSAKMMPLIKPLGFASPLRATRYSTGLYAAPGEVVTIGIPTRMVRRLGVQIGCHSDRLDKWVAAGQDWRRMPLIVHTSVLTQQRSRVSNPFGGLVYLTCKPTAKAWKADITISNAVMSPLFVLDRTTERNWRKMVAETGAPWGELATDRLIITLPTSVLRHIKDPGKRMRIWDRIVGATMDLAQLPLPSYRPQRMVTDVHIGGGFMHSGYPVMVHHCPEAKLVTEDLISDPVRFSQPSKGGPTWGFFHEIGHNMQNLDWVFNGTVEVSVNFFSLYCFDKIVGGRDEAHPGVSNQGTAKALNEFFSVPADFKKWSRDPFLGLVTFRIVQNDFGWNLFKRTFKRYHTLGAHERPRGDAQKRDMLVRFMSEEAKANLAPYFTAWGIPLSRKLKQDLKRFPTWMPFNFPPAT